MKKFYKKYIKEISINSIIFKLIGLVIVIVFPVVILNLVISEYSMKVAKNQIYNEREQILKLYINQIDTTLKEVESYLFNIANSDLDYIRINNLEPRNEYEEYQYEMSIISLYRKYNDKLKVYSIVTNIYSYFEDEDLLIISGKGNEHINESIKNIINGNELEEYLISWSIVEIDGENCLIRIIEKDGAYYGAVLRLDNVIKEMLLYDKNESRKYFFTDGTGVVFSNLYNLPKNFNLENKYIVEEDKNKKNYIVYVESSIGNFKFIELIPENEILKALPFINRLIKILSIISFFVIPIIIILLYKIIIIPLNNLSDAMKIIEDGDMEYRIKELKSSSEFEKLNNGLNNMMDQIKKLKFDVYDGKIERQKIKLRYLSQQVQPHFILNTLNIIYSYEPEDYSLIQKMILCLVKYFRYIVNVNTEFIELYKELEHIQNYLNIQRERYPNNFSWRIECEKGLETILIPPLVIQTFIENSIKYGLNIDEKIEIYVEVKSNVDGRVNIVIGDTGEGFSDTILKDIDTFVKTKEKQNSLGIGIQNTIERFEILYGGITEINMKNDKLGGARVELIIPNIKAK